jgi:hypothetical protein
MEQTETYKGCKSSRRIFRMAGVRARNELFEFSTESEQPVAHLQAIHVADIRNGLLTVGQVKPIARSLAARLGVEANRNPNQSGQKKNRSTNMQHVNNQRLPALSSAFFRVPCLITAGALEPVFG